MEYKECILNNRPLRVYADGVVKVKRCNRNEYYEMKPNTVNGYKQLQLPYKKEIKTYKIHRIIAFAYLDLDIEDTNVLIDHINRNILDNRVDNLRLVTQQENQFNRNAKGYCWNKQHQKWQAHIRVNGKLIHLGYFDNEDEASRTYQQAKLIHHVIETY